jgi:hypothetical protein
MPPAPGGRVEEVRVTPFMPMRSAFSSVALANAPTPERTRSRQGDPIRRTRIRSERGDDSLDVRRPWPVRHEEANV